MADDEEKADTPTPQMLRDSRRETDAYRSPTDKTQKIPPFRPASIPDAPPPAPRELEAFHTFILQRMEERLDEYNANINAAIQRGFKEGREASLEEHEKTRRKVAHLSTITTHLWAKVYGSDPPPPPPKDPSGSSVSDNEDSFSEFEEDTATRSKTLRDMEAQVSGHENELAEMQGHILRVQVQNEIQTALIKELMGKKDPNDERSFWRRFGDAFIWSFREREGQRYTLSLIAAIAGLVTAVGFIASMYYGRPWPPSSVHMPVPRPAFAPPAVDGP